MWGGIVTVLMPHWDSLYNSLMIFPFMISNSYLANSCHSTMSFLYFVYATDKFTENTDDYKMHHSTIMTIFIQLSKG